MAQVFRKVDLSVPQLTALCDATILTGEATVESHALLVRGGIIVDIVGNRHVPAEAQKINCREQILAPGLIDAQVNGGGNILLNNAPTPESCLAIAQAHRAYGTTNLLLTCISDTPEIMKQAVSSIRKARQTDTSILGMHLEGPHLSMEKRGVHNPSVLRAVQKDDIALYHRDGNEVLLITLAPENVPVETIQALSKEAIISLGHTNASPEQIRAALKAGATGFTHLYNGMTGMSARDSGVVGTALDDQNSWCGLIADGFHVAPEMIRVALRTKPRGKMFLVSDAMAPAATDDPKSFRLYGKTIKYENRRCTTADGKLAGSAITLLDAVRTCVASVGVELDEALRMATTYPASFLSLGHKFGKLLPNYTANVIAVTPALELKNVWSV